MMQKDDIPVFDANVYKRQYYDQFLSARWKQRSNVQTAATRESGAPAAAVAVAPPPSPDSWRVLFDGSGRYPLRYAQRIDARRSFFAAAEREHGRAALFMAATLSCIPLDPRLLFFSQFARCGCPAAAASFLQTSPNLAVEFPLLAVAGSFAVREVARLRRPEAKAVSEDEAMARARALASKSELFQGRLAMVFAAAAVLLVDPATISTPPLGAL